jgi:hypothetical protein
MKKEKYAALTQISRFITTAFPKQSRQHLIIQAELLEKDKRTNHYNDYLLFFPYLLTQIEPFLPTSFLMPIIKKRQGREKRWLAISAISDLKLAKKKYFTAESGVLLYEGDIDRAYNTYNAL